MFCVINASVLLPDAIVNRACRLGKVIVDCG